MIRTSQRFKPLPIPKRCHIREIRNLDCVARNIEKYIGIEAQEILLPLIQSPALKKILINTVHINHIKITTKRELMKLQLHNNNLVREKNIRKPPPLMVFILDASYQALHFVKNCVKCNSPKANLINHQTST